MASNSKEKHSTNSWGLLLPTPAYSPPLLVAGWSSRSKLVSFRNQTLCRLSHPQFVCQSSHSPSRFLTGFGHHRSMSRPKYQHSHCSPSAEPAVLDGFPRAPAMPLHYPTQPRPSLLQGSCAGAHSKVRRTNPPLKIQLRLSVTIKVGWQSATKFNTLKKKASARFYWLQDTNTQAVEN